MSRNELTDRLVEEFPQLELVQTEGDHFDIPPGKSIGFQTSDGRLLQPVFIGGFDHKSTVSIGISDIALETYIVEVLGALQEHVRVGISPVTVEGHELVAVEVTPSLIQRYFPDRSSSDVAQIRALIQSTLIEGSEPGNRGFLYATMNRFRPKGKTAFETRAEYSELRAPPVGLYFIEKPADLALQLMHEQYRWPKPRKIDEPQFVDLTAELNNLTERQISRFSESDYSPEQLSVYCQVERQKLELIRDFFADTLPTTSPSDRSVKSEVLKFYDGLIPCIDGVPKLISTSGLVK